MRECTRERTRARERASEKKRVREKVIREKNSELACSHIFHAYTPG